MTTTSFYSDRQERQRLANGVRPTLSNHPPKPTGYGKLLVDVYIDPLIGTLPAGTVVELHGDRIGGVLCGPWQRRTVERDGVVVEVMDVVERYTPPVVEMVVSPFTEQLVPATSGTARRYVKTEMEMVR